MSTIACGIIYTPDEGAAPLILARVRHQPTIMGAVRQALAEAVARESTAPGPIAARGAQEQAATLREILRSFILDHSPAVMG